MTSSDLLEARLILYRLLTVLFRYPVTGEKLSALANVQIAGDTQLAQAIQSLQETLVEDANFVERLNIEATRLMEGPGVTPAVPYASYYLNNQQLMGSAAQAARRTYLEHGVEPGQGSLPPDHICLELGFLSVLAEQALSDEFSEDALHASLVFLREHLKPWLPMFCTALEVNSQEPFFGGLASATRQFIAEDELWLQEMLLETVS